MKNPYNLSPSENCFELPADQQALHDILRDHPLDTDMVRLNQEILRSLKADQEAEEMSHTFFFEYQVPYWADPTQLAYTDEKTYQEPSTSPNTPEATGESGTFFNDTQSHSWTM